MVHTPLRTAALHPVSAASLSLYHGCVGGLVGASLPNCSTCTLGRVRVRVRARARARGRGRGRVRVRVRGRGRGRGRVRVEATWPPARAS